MYQSIFRYHWQFFMQIFCIYYIGKFEIHYVGSTFQLFLKVRRLWIFLLKIEQSKWIKIRVMIKQTFHQFRLHFFRQKNESLRKVILPDCQSLLLMSRKHSLRILYDYTRNTFVKNLRAWRTWGTPYTHLLCLQAC